MLIRIEIDQVSEIIQAKTARQNYGREYSHGLNLLINPSFIYYIGLDFKLFTQVLID